MSAPRLPYAVTLAIRTKGGTDLDIATFDYADLATARAFFRACCIDADTISVTLEGPDGTQLADYSNHACYLADMSANTTKA